MQNWIPNLGTIGFVLGLVLGLMTNKGIWSIMGSISLMWLGNGISGLLCGEINTALGHFTASAKHYTKDKEPKRFWFQVTAELIMGALIFFVFLKSPYE